ncbi:MAG: polysaccharide biosynthesis protein [Anaerolineae bacterium]|nr:polysaccharide biosynthesis protein [Anaerolineae bacterium]
MDNFAFVIHPLNPKQDVARKYPLLAKVLPTALIHFFSRFWPPVYLSHITGVRSEATGKEIEGWLLACPFTARQMVYLPPQTAYKKIVQTGRLAQRLGARILGLGAFTSVVGDGGVTVAQRLNIPVTTGHSLTVAIVIEALVEAARCRDIQPELVTTAVVGATGSIGSACAELLAPIVAKLVLIGRRESRLAQVQTRVEAAGARLVRISTQVEDIHEAHLVLSATSAARPIIQPQHLKHGAIVCDVARPPDVSRRVAREREDVLLIEGGEMDVPGEVDFGFDFGLPPGKAYACMAEAMVLALERRYESYSLGRQIRAEQVHEIAQLAHKHGFQISG